MSFPAPSRLRLDSAALVNNWKTMAKLSGSAATGAAVKADAYGLGAREVVPRLWAAGCRTFFVAHWAEAKAIADIVPASSIAVLNGVSTEDVELAMQLGALPVLNTPHQVSLWKSAGGGKCHLMLDTGINRLGLGMDQLDGQLFTGLEIDILLSHLASADQDSAQNASQLSDFLSVSQNLAAERVSLANSAGIALDQSYCLDLTRPGIAIYGGIPRAELSDKIRQVVWPEARILQIRTLDANMPVGYNATYRTKCETALATVSVGYADGYFRGFSDTGFFRCANQRFPVVGRVSMDLTIVDITSSNGKLREGDWLAMEFDLEKAALASGISQYELLTGLGPRYCRSWI